MEHLWVIEQQNLLGLCSRGCHSNNFLQFFPLSWLNRFVNEENGDCKDAAVKVCAECQPFFWLISYTWSKALWLPAKERSPLPARTLSSFIANRQFLNVCRFLIQHTNLFCAWLFNLVYSSALVLLSTWCVVVKAPQAGGAGVAEVMAYLNGCQLPKVWHLFSWCLDTHRKPWNVLRYAISSPENCRQAELRVTQIDTWKRYQ